MTFCTPFIDLFQVDFYLFAFRSAEIIIHLSNEGPDAYKSENYGNRIIIERKFSKDGASSYRIRSASGE